MADDNNTGAAGTTSTWDLPSDDFTATGLSKVDGADQSTRSEFDHKAPVDDAFDTVRPVINNEKIEEKTDQPSIKLDNIMKDTELEPDIRPETITVSSPVPSSSASSISDMETQLRDQKRKFESELAEIGRKKTQLDEILGKISKLKSEENELMGQAKKVMQ